MLKMESNAATLQDLRLRWQLRIMIRGTPISRDYADETCAGSFFPDEAGAVEVAGNFYRKVRP